VIHRAICGPTYHIGPRAGDNENPRAAAEGSVEGDLLISCKQQIAAYYFADLAFGPLANGFNAESSQPDAGLIDLAEADACGDRSLGQHCLQPARGLRVPNSHQLDAAGDSAREDSRFVSDDATCLRPAGIDREEKTHLAI